MKGKAKRARPQFDKEAFAKILEDNRAQCRFEWKLTSRTLPFLVHDRFEGLNRRGVFDAVKGGRSPAQPTLDGIEKAFTLKGLGLDAGLASCPRARPVARTSPPSGAG